MCMYSFLNTEKSAVDKPVLPTDVIEEFIRGAVTAVLSTCECYVVDILTESFDILIQFSANGDSSGSESSVSGGGNVAELKKLRKRWPQCQKVIQESIKRRSTKRNKPLEVVAFDLLVESNPYINLLGEHRQMVLRGLSPILLGDGGIEEAFCKLFSISMKHKDRNSKFSLINNMLSLLTGLQYTYMCYDGREINIRFVNGGTINDVLRLYYGARCIIAHGKPTKTMTEGSLRNFPTVDNLEEGLGNRRVAVEYRRLYERLKNEGRCIKLAYQELIGMYRFFFRLANCLMVSIAIALNNLSPKKPVLWNYERYLASSSRSQ